MATTSTSSSLSSALFPGPQTLRLGGREPSAPTIAIRPPSAQRPDTTDARLIALLDAPLSPGELASAGFARKEHELGAMFAAMSVLECRAIHGRLTSMRPGDELAHKFARLTLERRGRLLAFLADARRREALASAR